MSPPLEIFIWIPLIKYSCPQDFDCTEAWFHTHTFSLSPASLFFSPPLVPSLSSMGFKRGPGHWESSLQAIKLISRSHPLVHTRLADQGRWDTYTLLPSSDKQDFAFICIKWIEAGICLLCQCFIARIIQVHTVHWGREQGRLMAASRRGYIGSDPAPTGLPCQGAQQTGRPRREQRGKGRGSWVRGNAVKCPAKEFIYLNFWFLFFTPMKPMSSFCINYF